MVSLVTSPEVYSFTPAPAGSITPCVSGILIFTASIAIVPPEALFTSHLPVTTFMEPFSEMIPVPVASIFTLPVTSISPPARRPSPASLMPSRSPSIKMLPFTFIKASLVCAEAAPLTVRSFSVLRSPSAKIAWSCTLMVMLPSSVRLPATDIPLSASGLSKVTPPSGAATVRS